MIFVPLSPSWSVSDWEVTTTIEEKKHTLADIHIGIHVALAETGETIFDNNGSKLFTPASNLKIITSACALKVLGPQYRFTTDFLSSGDIGDDGVLDGDLVVRGFGDPTLADLRTLDLWRRVKLADKAYNLPHGIEISLESIAKRLHKLGLREVSGNLVIDDSYFDGKRVADGWTTDDESWFYASQTGALSVNENILTVIVRPGEQVGDLAIVTTNPAGYVRIDNHVITGRRGAKDILSFNRIRGENEVVVAGSLPLKHRRVVKFMTVDDPGLYMGYALGNVLESAGIRVQGYVRRKERKEGVRRSRLLVRSRSVPLSAIVHSLNKVSDNFYAEQLVKTIGAVKRGDGSWEGGLKVVQSFLKKFQFRGPYRVADGSGLSRYNLVTPRMITAVLRVMRRDKNFVDSLPVAGEDRGYGTLRRRMKRTLAAGNLRAKTGTLEDVSALSGYVNSLDGDLLVFSVMANQAVGNLVQEKHLQDRIGVLLASNRVNDGRDALQRICDAL